MKIYLLSIFLLSIFANGYKTLPKIYHFDNENFQYNGRYELLENNAALISPGASVAIKFSGNYCSLFLKAESPPYNYISLELDGKYLGRLKIKSDTIIEYAITVTSKKRKHFLKIIKDSEASNGVIFIRDIAVNKLLKNKSPAKKFIEFIGNSVTCGAASDNSFTLCGSGEYFDQQNVYKAYGPSVAREFNADFMLSSVSGIGIYRNWNDENIEEPIMPEVYENLYLNTNSTKPYKFSRKPDIVSICLGTNDLSNGDGTKTRLPFNKEKYVSNYIDFVKVVYNHYSNTQIVLLNSPMIVGENNELLVSCLKEVQEYFAVNYEKSILLFEFKKEYINGCNYHPSIQDHKEISSQLMPLFKSVLNK